MQQKNALPTCHAEMIDTFDQTVVEYMAGRRNLGEKAMRNLLDTDADTKASYDCKIGRLVAAAHAKGFTPERFNAQLLHKRMHSWAYSPDAGPQLPTAGA